jgi:hypothetical protein
VTVPSQAIQDLVTRQVSSFGDFAERLLWPAMLRRLDRLDTSYRN